MKSPFILFRESYAFYKTRFALLMGIVLVPVAVDVAISFLPLSVLGNIVSFVVSIFTYIALILTIDNPSGIGTIQNAYRTSIPLFFGYFFVSIITNFIVVVGIIAFLVPGILFTIWFTSAAFVVVLEKRGIFESIQQSRKYARGKWSPIFGRLVVLGLSTFAVLAFCAIVFAATGLQDMPISDMAINVLSWLLTPFIYTYLYLLYKELKHS